MGSLRGVSLMDVLVGSAIFAVVFTALFGILRTSVAVSGLAKVKAAATAIASSHIEYIRSLSYNEIGTVGGIPSGAIDQATTTTQAGLTFSLRTFIVYADDPADGTGASDGNGITTDYKRVKVTVSYTVDAITREVTLFTNIVPNGIESTVGGGTIRVNVVDAQGAPVSGATVRVFNTVLSPTVDITTFSDINGSVLFGGAPTSTDYQIQVSKDGYSSASTYDRTATNVNPTPSYLTVAEGQTTTGTFAIDQLATFTVRTFSPIAPNSFSDTFSTDANVPHLFNAVVSGGDMVLSGGVGAYASNGDARSIGIAPQYLASWEEAGATLTAPAGTQVVFQVMDASDTLLPDAVLPGNSAGFTAPVSLASVSTSTYPTLKLSTTLQSTDVLLTPSVSDWYISYTEGPLPLPNIDFTLQGAKTIGSDAGGVPLYKTTIATSTDGEGVRTLSLEWDSYTFSAPSNTVVTLDPLSPFDVLPNTTGEATVILEP